MSLVTQSHLRVFQGVVRAADWLTARLRPSRVARHLQTGERGEEDAFFHLRRQGYVVVARRYRSALCRGDIDLIAWDGSTLCFIEVKTRSSRNVASAESSVDDDKRRTLRRLARVYLRTIPHTTAPEPETRFDILSLYYSKESAAEFELFQGAFDWY
ncbi:MAG TPA: YraN family protein [Acidisarcina sp.]|nr:YraN family protein [Acidisarcina sp.]